MNHTRRGRSSKSDALYAFDAAWAAQRQGPLSGADETGRGALAGPLLAAAVVLGEDKISGIDDSKMLGEQRREELYGEVLEGANALCVVAYPAWWIDRHGVSAANKDALKQVLEGLRPYSGCGLADGNLKLGPGVECLPKADGKSAAVAAASVVAKVLRDGAMRTLAEMYSRYGFERNRGYGTREHRLVLQEAGPCRVHRLSYAGVIA
ncbi:MAG TPA: ribonuclease HII [Rubrobacteraceae bacterium]|nr:ribonuclease HII [Rubrobacteraceae bacterium]